METAIQVIWWIGLLGAIAATIVVLKQVALILRALSDIRRLAELTREAAEGASENLAGVDAVEAADAPARRLHTSVAALVDATTSTERKLDAAARPDAGD